MLQWFRKQPENGQASGNSGDLLIALTRKLIDFLASQISTPKRASSILSQIARFKELPPTYQEKELPSIYLKIEQFLVDEDPMQKFTRQQLRKTVKYRYEPLMELENFSVIFAPDTEQEILLSQYLLKSLMMRAANSVGPADEQKLTEMAEWVFHIPDTEGLEVPFDAATETPQTLKDWVPLLAKVSRKIYLHLEGILGEQEAAALFEKSYRELAEIYRPLETFYVVVQLLPDKLLDENKIGLLSGEQIRNVFLNKVDHLQRINEQISLKNVELNDARDELLIAQDTAMESVKLFHAVLDTVEEGIITADADGKIILVNEQIKTIFGYDEEEMVGQTVEMLMPEKYREQHRKGMQRYVSTGESHSINQRLLLEGLRKNKKVFPLEIQITKTQISDRLFFTAAMRDISDDVKYESQLKKTSDNLRHSEQKYRNLVESMSDIIFSLSLDGTFTSLNTAFEKATQLNRDDWIGKPFTQLIHQDDSMSALKMFQAVLQGDTAPTQELRLRLEDDRSMIGEFTISPQHQNGKLIGALGIAKDVTKAKKSVEHLRISEQSHRQLLENCPDAIGVNHNGRLVFLNRAGRNMLGVTNPKQLLNKQFLEIIHPDHRPAAKARMKEVIQNGAHPTFSEEKMLRLDGEAVDIEITEAPVTFQNKKAIQFVLRKIEPRTGNGHAGSDDAGKLFRDLFDAAIDPVMINDPGGRALEVNEAASSFFGAGRDTLIGQKFANHIVSDQKEEVTESLLLLAQEKLDRFEATIQRTDGSECPVEVRGKRISYAGKLAMMITIRDISSARDLEVERQKLAEELRYARLQTRESEGDHDELRQQLKDARMEVQDAQMKYRGVKVTLEDTEDKLKNTQSALQDEQKKFSEVSGEMEVLKQRYHESQMELREQQIQLKENQLKMDTLEKKYEAAQNQQDGHLAQVKRLEEQLDELNRRHEQASDAVYAEQEKYQDLQKELEDARDKVITAEKQQESSEGEIEHLKSRLEEVQSKLYNSAKEFQNAQDRQQSLQADLEASEHQLKDAQLELQANQLTIQELEQQRSETREKLADTREQLQNDQIRLEDLQERLDQTEKQFQDSQIVLQEKEMELQELRLKIDSMEKRFVETESEAKDQLIRYEDLQDKLRSTEKRYHELQDELQQKQERYLDMQEKYLDMRGRLREAEAKAAGANGKVDESAMEALRQELSEAADKLAGAERQIETLQRQVGKLGKLIPLNSEDGSIRDDYEFWQLLEEYANDPDVLAVLPKL